MVGSEYPIAFASGMARPQPKLVSRGRLDFSHRETDARYLIVTHNAVTTSRMHRLFGVTMVEKGVSRLVSVDLGGAEDLLAAE